MVCTSMMRRNCQPARRSADGAAGGVAQKGHLTGERRHLARVSTRSRATGAEGAQFLKTVWVEDVAHQDRRICELWALVSLAHLAASPARVETIRRSSSSEVRSGTAGLHDGHIPSRAGQGVVSKSSSSQPQSQQTTGATVIIKLNYYACCKVKPPGAGGA